MTGTHHFIKDGTICQYGSGGSPAGKGDICSYVFLGRRSGGNGRACAGKRVRNFHSPASKQPCASPWMWDSCSAGSWLVSRNQCRGQARKEGVRAVRPSVRASRINGTGIFRAFLLLTLLSLPAPILAQTAQLVWLTNVTGSVAEGGTINFTVNRINRFSTGLPVKVDIVPASPIDGFNIISGGHFANGDEVTVTIPADEVSASGWIGTDDNSIVNDDVEITVSIDASSSSAYHTSTLQAYPWSVASTVTKWRRRLCPGGQAAGSEVCIRHAYRGGNHNPAVYEVCRNRKRGKRKKLR